MRYFKYLLLCLLGFTLLNPLNLFPDVKVGATVWQTVGGGCIPDDEAIQGNWYQAVTAAGRVKYKGDHTNTLRFTCPISSVNPTSAGGDKFFLIIYYQDPDGPGEDFQVIGRLMRFAKSNGHLKVICTVISGKSGQWQSSDAFFDTLDLSNNVYWLEVLIRRKKSSSKTVEFNAAELVRVKVVN